MFRSIAKVFRGSGASASSPSSSSLAARDLQAAFDWIDVEDGSGDNKSGCDPAECAAGADANEHLADPPADILKQIDLDGDMTYARANFCLFWKSSTLICPNAMKILLHPLFRPRRINAASRSDSYLLKMLKLGKNSSRTAPTS